MNPQIARRTALVTGGSRELGRAMTLELAAAGANVAVNYFNRRDAAEQVWEIAQQRIQIGSEVFEIGSPRFANYVASKGAQLGLTRSWARELAPTGITVNLVAPGWIPTERHADAPQDELESYARSVPMQHMGNENDIAKMVTFLASDDAGFITGQKFSVNGGNTLA